MSRTVVWSVGIVMLIGASSAAWAGGRGPMFRPGGFGGGGYHMTHAMPPVAGTWHERSGRSFITGGGQPHPGFGFGHTNTSFAAGRGHGGYGYDHGFVGGQAQAGSFGHTQTAPNSSERWRTAGVGGTPGDWRGRVGYRYGVADAGRFGVHYGHYRRLAAGPYGHGYGRYAYGGRYGYGGGYDTSGGYTVSAPYSGGGGYTAPSLASQYSEPPLNYGAGSGDYGVGAPGEGSPSVAGTGAPQVIVVNNNYGGSGCNCHAVRSPGPVVYRYGVGTYY